MSGEREEDRGETTAGGLAASFLLVRLTASTQLTAEKLHVLMVTISTGLRMVVDGGLVEFAGVQWFLGAIPSSEME